MEKTSEERIRKIIFSEFTLGLTIASLAWAAFTYINTPTQKNEKDIIVMQKDIETIRTNELVHINADLQEIKKWKDEHQQQTNVIERKIDELTYILNKK